MHGFVGYDHATFEAILEYGVEDFPADGLGGPESLGLYLEWGNGGLHPDAAYIYKKQLEESDIILLSKSDVLKREETAVLRQLYRTRFRVRRLYRRVPRPVRAWTNGSRP